MKVLPPDTNRETESFHQLLLLTEVSVPRWTSQTLWAGRCSSGNGGQHSPTGVSLSLQLGRVSSGQCFWKNCNFRVLSANSLEGGALSGRSARSAHRTRSRQVWTLSCLCSLFRPDTIISAWEAPPACSAGVCIITISAPPGWGRAFSPSCAGRDEPWLKDSAVFSLRGTAPHHAAVGCYYTSTSTAVPK